MMFRDAACRAVTNMAMRPKSSLQELREACENPNRPPGPANESTFSPQRAQGPDTILELSEAPNRNGQHAKWE